MRSGSDVAAGQRRSAEPGLGTLGIEPETVMGMASAVIDSVSDDDLVMSIGVALDWVNSYTLGTLQWLEKCRGMNLGEAKAVLEADSARRKPATDKMIRALLDADFTGFPFDQPRYWLEVYRLGCSAIGCSHLGGPLLRRLDSYACEELAHVVKRNTRWWTTQETAYAMQVSESYVRRMARTGRVTARRHPTDSWRIWSPSARRYCK